MGTDMMRLRNIVLAVAAVAFIAGCSFERQQVDYKTGAIKAPPLEVPPDLTSPETESRYTIPGSDGARVAKYSEYSKQKTEQPCIAPENTAPVAKTAAKTGARLLESNGAKRIQMDEPFDRSWRKIGLALEKAHIKATDMDRSKGIYFFAPVPDKDKKKLPDHQILVRENTSGSEVTVVDAEGKSNAETARMLDKLFQNLEK